MTDEEFQRWKTEIEGAVGHLRFRVGRHNYCVLAIYHDAVGDPNDDGCVCVCRSIHDHELESPDWVSLPREAPRRGADWAASLRDALSPENNHFPFYGDRDPFTTACILKALQSITVPSHAEA